MDNGNDKRLYLTLGSLKSGVEGLDKKVDEVKQDVRDARNEVNEIKNELVSLNGATVKQGDCVARVQSLHDAINGLQRNLSKKQTRDDNPVVQQPTTQEVPIESADRSLVTKLKDNIGLMVLVLTLMGILVGGGIKIARFMVRVEDLVVKNSMKTKVIYVRPSDAGAKNKRK